VPVDDLGNYDVAPVDGNPFGSTADSPQNYDVAPVDHDPFQGQPQQPQGFSGHVAAAPDPNQPMTAKYIAARSQESASPYTPPLYDRAGNYVSNLAQSYGVPTSGAERMGTATTTGLEAASYAPVVGAPLTAAEGVDAYSRGDIAGAAASGLGTLAMFLGPAGRLVDREGLAAAKTALQSGEHPYDVWNQHLWEHGPGDSWRTEIADPTHVANWGQHGETKTIGEVYPHPELYENYPGLENTPVDFIGSQHLPPGAMGAYDSTHGRFLMNADLTPWQRAHTVTHELQHSVQGLEGWPGGADPEKMDVHTPGSPGNFALNFIWKQTTAAQRKAMGRDNLINEAKRFAYETKAGEAQAENPGARLGMSMPERRDAYPATTEQIPRSNQWWVDPSTGKLRFGQDVEPRASGGPVQLNADLRRRLALVTNPRHGFADGGAPDDPPPQPTAGQSALDKMVQADRDATPEPAPAPVDPAPAAPQTWYGKWGQTLADEIGSIGPAIDAGIEEGGKFGANIIADPFPGIGAPRTMSPESEAKLAHGISGVTRELSSDPMIGGDIGGVSRAVEEVSTAGRAKNMAEVPDIRGMHVDDAIALARKNPHLIPTPSGGFVGAPRSIRNMDDLQTARANFDKYVDEETSGWDWYERYRTGQNTLTGGDPLSNQWMPKLEGVWSAGVDPQSEIGRVIKETTGAVVGSPRRANYGAQHESLVNAIAENDPSRLQLGRKTGQYAARVSPIQTGPPTATGVNDFRYANQWGFLPAEGSLTRDGEITLTEPQHRWLDYETALAVDRANQRQLLGRSDWTGEQIQAMPWVRQKAESIEGESPRPQYPLSGYQTALSEAMKTAPDYAPGFRGSETFEPQPGEDIAGHLTGAPSMTQDQRLQYARFVDPETGFGSSMTDPKTGRDILYGGQRVYGGPSGTEPTGVAPYVMPTVPTQGYYRNNANLLETNPGYSATPLTSFDVGPKTGRLPAQGPPQESGALAFTEREYPKVKGLSPESEEQMRTAAYVRSVMNSQQAGAGNVGFANPPLGVSNSYIVPLNRPATVDEIAAHEAVGAKYGLPHAVNDSRGITVTNFEGGQPTWTPKTRKQFLTDMKAIEPEDAAGPGVPGRTDAIYEPVDWNAREPGKGQISQEMINRITKNRQVEQAYARNPFLPPQVQANAARYEAFKDKTGQTAQDIWNTQQLMGEGPGWVQKMKDILAGKAAIPAATAAGVTLFPKAGLAAPQDQQPQPRALEVLKRLQAQRFAGAGQR
jgi:hypothetical protein